MKVNEEAKISYITAEKNSDVLFTLYWSSNSATQIDLNKIVKWPGNEGC